MTKQDRLLEINGRHFRIIPDVLLTFLPHNLSPRRTSGSLYSRVYKSFCTLASSSSSQSCHLKTSPHHLSSSHWFIDPSFFILLRLLASCISEIQVESYQFTA